MRALWIAVKSRTDHATPLVTIVALALASTAAIARPTVALELEGVRFAPTVDAGGARFDLNCVGLLRYKVFIKASVAAFYLGAGVAPEDALADVPKRLELHYFWSIGSTDFAKAADRLVRENVDSKTLEQLGPRIAQINGLYEDIRPGDRYALTYVPGVGTELALNGHRKGVIPGADFADAYFRIWLGERPLDTALRDRLLGCESLFGRTADTPVS